MPREQQLSGLFTGSDDPNYRVVIVNPSLVWNGLVVGTWKRTFNKKGAVVIAAKPYGKMGAGEMQESWSPPRIIAGNSSAYLLSWMKSNLHGAS